MNHHLNDPELQALEARLAGLAPRVAPQRQQEMLYDCGFAAGVQAQAAKLRTWQAAAASLLLLAAGLSAYVAQDRTAMVAQGPAPAVKPQSSAPVPVSAPAVEPPSEVLVLERRVRPVPLDAWEVAPAPERISAAPHSLSVASLTRSLAAEASH